jgi:hypothetical protein
MPKSLSKLPLLVLGIAVAACDAEPVAAEAAADTDFPAQMSQPLLSPPHTRRHAFHGPARALLTGSALPQLRSVRLGLAAQSGRKLRVRRRGGRAVERGRFTKRCVHDECQMRESSYDDFSRLISKRGSRHSTQEVCPWNSPKFVTLLREQDFGSRGDAEPRSLQRKVSLTC